MKHILKLLVVILNLIFVLFKLLPVCDKITYISRQANEPTEDIQLLGDEVARKAPHLQQVFLCRKLDGG